MYIIDSGIFIVFKKNQDGVSEEVFRYSDCGAAFGELSLMYTRKRAVSTCFLTQFFFFF
jgi:CRP-like cAMP-binding protein